MGIGAIMEEQQHMVALLKANRIRIERANIKKDIKSGALRISEILSELPESVFTMTIGELLSCRKRYGIGRVTKILRELQINPHRRCCELTTRQRKAISEALGETTPPNL